MKKMPDQGVAMVHDQERGCVHGRNLPMIEGGREGDRYEDLLRKPPMYNTPGPEVDKLREELKRLTQERNRAVEMRNEMEKERDNWKKFCAKLQSDLNLVSSENADLKSQLAAQCALAGKLQKKLAEQETEWLVQVQEQMKAREKAESELFDALASRQHFETVADDHKRRFDYTLADYQRVATERDKAEDYLQKARTRIGELKHELAAERAANSMGAQLDAANLLLDRLGLHRRDERITIRIERLMVEFIEGRPLPTKEQLAWAAGLGATPKDTGWPFGGTTCAYPGIPKG